jgi:hypothetical protein
MVGSIAGEIERKVAAWPGVTVVSHGSDFLEFRIG